MSSAPTETLELPQPPPILSELYRLASTPGTVTHPSIFYGDDELLPTPASSATHGERPFVTLTFAQSLDAKIAGAGGKQLVLSGKESLVMTHWMRTLHDAILIGIGTALNDNPQLNTRHLPPLPPGYPYTYRLPQPVILDTHLRLPPACKLLQNFQAGRGRRPWVVCARQTAGNAHDQCHAEGSGFDERANALRAAGAHVVEVDADNATGTGLIDVSSLLAALRERGVRSLMVEGGARVIGSFLSAAARGPGETRSRSSSESEDSDVVVHALVVTVAPTLVGDAGVGYGSRLLAETLPTFKHVRTEAFGPDAVVALRVL